MGERPDIAAIIAAAKEHKAKIEADEVSKQREAEDGAAAAELQNQQVTDQKVADLKAKQERLVQVQEQRDSDAESLKAIRAKLKEDRQTVRDIGLPEEDQKSYIDQVNEASQGETGGDELTREEIGQRHVVSRAEKNVLNKDIDNLVQDESVKSSIEETEKRAELVKQLEFELAKRQELAEIIDKVQAEKRRYGSVGDGKAMSYYIEINSKLSEIGISDPSAPKIISAGSNYNDGVMSAALGSRVADEYLRNIYDNDTKIFDIKKRLKELSEKNS